MEGTFGGYVYINHSNGDPAYMIPSDVPIELIEELRKDLAMEDKMYRLYEYVIYDRKEGKVLVTGEISVRANNGLIVAEQVAVQQAALLSKNKDKFESGEVVILTRPFC